MKYISRITALLLVLMMLTPTFASALTLGTATQGDLDKLYQEASEDGVIYLNAGLLGDWSELSAFGNLAAKELYSFQWFNEAGEILPCFNDPWVTRVSNTMAEQKFYCVATDATGNELLSPVYVVPAADISNLDHYMSLLYDERFLDVLGAADTLTLYRLMTDIWNVLMPDGKNLAESVVAQWWSEREESYFDPYLLCSCVVSGAVASDECVLHPNSDLHVNGCSWKQPEISANVDVSTPESLLMLENVVLAAEERPDVDAYAWQNYVYDPAIAGMRWAVVEYVQDTNLYTIQINKESIQTAYRVVIETTDYNVFESKPLYLGGYDFFNWILTNEDIQVWMADDSVTLADVVARYNNAADEEDRTNAEDYTYGEEGESVNLKVPQGTFAEDYVMEIAPATLSDATINAVLQSMDATDTAQMQVLTAFDIAFAALADRTRKLQPAEGTSVALTFEVDTTGLDEALKYLYVYHIANDGTPEVVAGPIDAAQQEIQVEAESFSIYAVVLSSDSCAYCQNNAECVYKLLLAQTNSKQYNYVNGISGQALADFLEDYEAHVSAGEMELLCTCDKMTEAPGSKHSTICPWNSTYAVIADVVGWQTELSAPDGEGTYRWYDDSGDINNTTNTHHVYVENMPHTYYCDVKTDGYVTTYTYNVGAQTTVLSAYADMLFTYFDPVLYDERSFEEYVNWAYSMMTGVNADPLLHWNFEVYDENSVFLYNMAEAVLSYWYQTDGNDLLCSCCIDAEGNVVSTADGMCVLPWDAVHDANCPWHHAVDVSNFDALKDLELGAEITLTTTLSGNLEWQQGIVNADGTITWDEQNPIATGENCTMILTGETLTKVYRCVDTDTGVASPTVYIGGEVFFTWAVNAADVAAWLALEGNKMEYVLAAYEAYLKGIALAEVIHVTTIQTTAEDGSVVDALCLLELHGLTTLAEIDADGNVIDTRYHIAVATYDATTGTITELGN